MAHVNIEIKARCADVERVRRILNEHKAEFKGTDHQADTYFKVPKGRLKLRRGNIENALIYYERPDQAGPKRTEVSLFRTDAAGAEQLHTAMTSALDVLVVVDKRREIYFIDNVKFHIDAVEGLGSFIEIEAIDESGAIEPEKLRQQCEHYIRLFGIPPADLIERSYSDLLAERERQ